MISSELFRGLSSLSSCPFVALLLMFFSRFFAYTTCVLSMVFISACSHFDPCSRLAGLGGGLLYAWTGTFQTILSPLGYTEASRYCWPYPYFSLCQLYCCRCCVSIITSVELEAIGSLRTVLLAPSVSPSLAERNRLDGVR